MTVSLLKSVGASNPLVFRNCCDSILEIFKKLTSSSLSAVIPGSIQADSIQAIISYAEDIAMKTRGSERSLAIGLIFGVAVSSGSLQDVLRAVKLLQNGSDKLPEKAYSFVKVLNGKSADWELIAPTQESLASTFVTRNEVNAKSSLSFLEHIPSVASDGSHLYIWNGHNCTITKLGSGFHGTIEGMNSRRFLHAVNYRDRYHPKRLQNSA
jgi:hypothetical protein